MDHAKFQDLNKSLYSTAKELETMFPCRHFALDGHVLGSIRECLVADAYGLELKKASNKGFDALSKSGKQVEIKATQKESFSFRSKSEHIIAIKISENGQFVEVYNVPGELVWKEFDGKKTPKNGQFQKGLKRLKELDEQVDESQRIPSVAHTHKAH